TGSAPQSKGALNVPESGLKATVFYAVKALLDPGLLPNSGLFEAVRITAPEGSIVNPRFPSAVGARSITCQKIAGAIFGAFRGLLAPEDVMASSNDVLPAIVFSGRHRRSGRTYVYLETLGGGAGARLGRDGMDGIQVHVTNTSKVSRLVLRAGESMRIETPGGGGAGPPEQRSSERLAGDVRSGKVRAQ